MSTFTFNRNYKDLDQVAQFLPAYLEVYEEIVAAGEYPYNDSFHGRIPGIDRDKEGETAIYLLQHTRHQMDLDAKVASYLADGFEPIDAVPAITKFARVVVYSDSRWSEYADARLVPEDYGPQSELTGCIRSVLPKGKRTHGSFVSGAKVMVKR